MKIFHLCLASFYIEGMEYQENVLPRVHKRLGYDVTIGASRYSFDSNGKRKYRSAGRYVNSDGVPIIILEYYPFFKFLTKRLKIYKGLYRFLLKNNPDIIFIHGAQSYSVWSVIKYKKKNPNVLIFADQHGDYFNMPLNGVYNCFINKYLFGIPVRAISHYVEVFWGVTPWRVKYLNEVYGISKNIIKLLVMGGDEKLINFENKNIIKKQVREKLGVYDDDFLIVSGGKIDKMKNIHLLINAIRNINNEKVKLIIFGKIKEDIMSELNILADKRIYLVGWVSPLESYNLFLASNLAVFPGTHSVLWEQAAACGIPIMVKFWDGMMHLDVGNNCIFLKSEDECEIQENITKMLENPAYYNYLSQAAINGKTEFSYSEIAKKSIVPLSTGKINMS